MSPNASSRALASLRAQRLKSDRRDSTSSFSARSSTPRLQNRGLRYLARWFCPSQTFSQTVISRNRRTPWNVLPIPSRQIWAAVMCVIEPPRNRTSPDVGRVNPVTRLKTVVLPAPFGPMMPSISPDAQAMSTSSRARRPPKDFDNPSISSSADRPASAMSWRYPVAGRVGETPATKPRIGQRVDTSPPRQPAAIRAARVPP